ncbi:class I SAM-dependent methyltransferase [Candidatus Pelagibacter bacterium nBUS_32]|uniref:class I SAM-dependent methyltransferase n=1 Tax=Candidatus Pelagibacter bacterium nBUS_32 TaxID=3374192 RepID=UPI003EBC32C0
MTKILKVLRGFKLIYLNCVFYNLKFIGFKISFFLITNIFTKFFYYKFKNLNVSNAFFNYSKKFKFTKNYFKHNPPIWFEIFKKNHLFEKKVNILEIGSYEGMSMLFFQKFLNIDTIYCVDLFKNDNFISNQKYFKNINFFNSSSDDFFKKNIKIEFDIIYVDGSHYGPEVYRDLVNSDNLLKKNGILIIDDFLYELYSRRNVVKFHEEVMGAVFMFLKKNLKYKILYTGHQLILKKLTD